MDDRLCIANETIATFTRTDHVDILNRRILQTDWPPITTIATNDYPVSAVPSESLRTRSSNKRRAFKNMR